MSAFKDIYMILETTKERPPHVGISHMGESCGRVSITSLDGRKDLFIGQAKVPLVPWFDLNIYGEERRVYANSSAVIYLNLDTCTAVAHECDNGRQLLFLITSEVDSYVVGDIPRLGRWRQNCHPKAITLRQGLYLSTISLGFGVNKVCHNLASGDSYEATPIKENAIKTTNRSILMLTTWNSPITQTIEITPTFIRCDRDSAKIDKSEINEKPTNVEHHAECADVEESVQRPGPQRSSFKTRANKLMRRVLRFAASAIHRRH